MPTIIGAGDPTSGYEIENSLRFNDDDSPLLTRAISTNPSDQKLTTISFWFKIGNITSSFRSLYRFNDGSATGLVYLRNGNDLQFGWDVSSGTLDVRPNGVLRDPSAWYHFHAKVDTTQGTAANRVIIHINGVERTYSTATYPDQNATLNHLTNGKTYYIGGDGQSSDKYFDGYITEFNVIDGQAKDYTDFGEFDDNGVWIPKKYTGTYGNNGFYLEFKQTGTSANSSGIGADTSGNDLHWTPSNLAAIDITTDTPTNNFATLNPIGTIGTYEQQQTAGLTEGNLEIPRSRSGGESDGAATSTFAFPRNGKWYYEFKWASRDTGNAWAGIVTHIDASTNVIYYANNGNSYVNASSASYGATYTVGDIIGVAVNKDDNQVTFYKNGSSQGTLTNSRLATYDFHVYMSDGGGSDGPNYQLNFGNPVHSISSGNSDANGYGNFEYAVPSGYYALCTKNIAEFG